MTGETSARGVEQRTARSVYFFNGYVRIEAASAEEAERKFEEAGLGVDVEIAEDVVLKTAGKRRHDQVVADRDRYIRAFNSLEKAVTKHVANCIDADALERAHRIVMRMLAEGTI